MENINFLAVLVLGIVQMIIGMIWYGPLLFGNKWMEFTGMKGKSPEEMKAMQKAATPLYGVQFLVSLLMNTVLAYFVINSTSTGIFTALALWIGFVVPIQAGGVLWEVLTHKQKVEKFLIGAGYQLITMVLAGYVFGVWS